MKRKLQITVFLTYDKLIINGQAFLWDDNVKDLLEQGDGARGQEPVLGKQANK